MTDAVRELTIPHGIRIEDAALEISPEGLGALLNKSGVTLKVTRLSVTVSPDALNTLLAGSSTTGTTGASRASRARAELSDGRIQLHLSGDGTPLTVDLSAGGIHLMFREDGLRLYTGDAE